MNFPKRRSIFIFSITIIAIFTLIPILNVKGEKIQLFYIDFNIQPSQPDVISIDNFELNEENEYILGIPESEAIGSRSLSRSYFFEIWSSARVEAYILDDSRSCTVCDSQYTKYIEEYIGDPPSSYVYKFICDGYLRVQFTNNTLVPKLIIYSNGVEVTGKYFWTEGLAYTNYYPYHLLISGSDRLSNDTLHFFNVNASISIYILNDDNYSTYLLTPNSKPLSLITEVSVSDVFETDINYIASPNMAYHILIWHEELYDSVNGTLIYYYEYQRAFFSYYWSFFFVIILLAIFILSFIYQKATLPVVVWTTSKLKYYLLKIPGKAFKDTFRDLRSELSGIYITLARIKEEEISADNISKFKKDILILFALLGIFGIHRYVVGKINTGILYTFTAGFFLFGFIIDLIAIFMGHFKDKEGKYIRST